MRRAALLVTILGLVSLVGCREAVAEAPLQPVPHVDLPRYMGSWYVVASIPTRFERNSYNPVETYRLDSDGRICTSFRFHDGGFEGPVKKIHSVATVDSDTGNAQWRVHLFWILREQYIVAWLAPAQVEQLAEIFGQRQVLLVRLVDLRAAQRHLQAVAQVV